jgi:hypothetical protein
MSDELHASGVLRPEKKPLDGRLGGPQSLPERGSKEKTSALVGDRTLVVQPVTSHYTNSDPFALLLLL